MSAFQIFTLPAQQALDSSARVLAGATLDFYLTGTTTRTDAYSDSGLATPVANPLTADAGGVFDQFFLDPTVTYKIVLKTSAGATLKTWDPANENVLSSAIIATTLDSLKRTAAEIAAGVTPTNYAYPPGDIRRYGGDNVNVVDSSTAAYAALLSHGFCYLGGGGTYYLNLTLTTTRAYIFGDGAYATTVKNWGNSPVFTLDSTGLSFLVNVKICGMRIDNRASATYTSADGIYITGSDSTVQNDYHEFRDLLITSMRHAVVADYRAIWITLDRVTALTCLDNSFHIDAAENVDMWSWHLCRALSSGGYGLYVNRDSGLAVPADSWKLALCDFERNSLNGVRISGQYGIQGFSFETCHFESNAEDISASATTPNRKAHVHADADYMIGLFFKACTFYGNDTAPNHDWAIYVDTSAAVTVVGGVDGCRFSTPVVGDVWWPMGCKLGLNAYGGIRTIDASKTSIDLQAVTELGTWTPGVSFGGGTTGITYSNQVGRYVLNGRTVTASAYVSLTNKGSSTGAAKITGLPYTSVNVTNLIAAVSVVVDQLSGSLEKPIFGSLSPNGTTIDLYKLVTGGLTALTDADFSNGSTVRVTVTYFI